MTQPVNERTDAQSRIARVAATERRKRNQAKRRELMLNILERQPSAIALDDLAAEIAAREGGIDTSDETEVRNVAVTLHHNHLPRMAAIGVLEYDAESHRVRT